MPCGYFYSCQGNEVIYVRPGPLQGCVINTPGLTLSFAWRGSLSLSFVASLLPLSCFTQLCPHICGLLGVSFLYVAVPLTVAHSPQASGPWSKCIYQTLSGVIVVWELALMREKKERGFEFELHISFKRQVWETGRSEGHRQ